ncbi:MAG TPA: hypothetical protein VEV83_06455, partial [Parafilimonas sp.]|nr:hypothetical protein [Parafilimonas sp.]
MEFDNDRPVKRPYRIEILYWILLGLMNPLVSSLTIFLHDAKTWAVVLLINLLVLPAYLFYSMTIVPRFLFQRKYVQFFALSVLFLISLQLVLFSIYSLILKFSLSPAEQSYFTYTDGTIIRENLWSVINMSMAIGIYFIKKALDEKETLENLEKDNANFKLKYLRSQLNPHFLFNT